tara:strand:- start:1403 stop:4063 length:2661 start_codon:yes stop_codon:yes gene_type:complete
MNSNWHKKEKPLLGLTGMGGGVDGLGVTGLAAKVYVDDVYSTYVYTGTGSAQTINNGIDISGKGGLIWTKQRTSTADHHLHDTTRTNSYYYVRSNLNNAETWDSNTITSFNSNGFTLGSDTTSNWSGKEFASWTFRKQKGFFDVVSYSGNGSARTISHSLGSVPGMIMIKGTSNTNSWYVYHRDIGPEKYLRLNGNDSATDQSWFMNDTLPTSSEFSLGTSSNVNGTGQDYVAYIFAGGKKNDDNAVNFDGSGDYLSLAASSDLTLDADFTIEWFSKRQTGGGMSVIGIGDYNNVGGMEIFFHTTASGGKVHIYTKDSSSGANRLISADAYAVDRYQHCALVRSGSTITFYLDGKNQGSWTESQTLGPSGNNTLTIGRSTYNGSGVAYWNGKISNFRITKGQALYTTNFNVPHDALTQTSQNAVSSNVKLLCCNGSTTTSSTVTPGTITANGDPNIQGSQYIFDDTAAHVFGDESDQGIIQTGSYIGNGSSTGPEINLGWEPQWVMIKDISANYNWRLHDIMRGIVTGGNDPEFEPNTDDSETDTSRLDVTPTGFKITTSSASHNDSGDTYIYMAMRRPDGYVGKPAEAGTEVFAMDTGNSSSTEAFTSNFPVDFALTKEITNSGDWGANGRLIQTKNLVPNNTTAETTWSAYTFDSNTGWLSNNAYTSAWQSWMWKRHAGFDVVTWTGTNTSVVRRHNLGRTPEMIWFKNRVSSTRNWRVYHKGLNGGSNPEDYSLKLNSNDAESSNTSYMTGTAPTSTTFVAGNDDDTNGFGDGYIAMLFSSIEGVSKVDTYTGTGSSGLSVTTGFQPRFLLIKRSDAGSTPWNVYDSVRGFSSGNDSVLYLDMTNAANTSTNFGEFTSTGFTINETYSDINNNGGNYLYYAHA